MRRLVIDSRCRRSGESANAYTVDFASAVRAGTLELVRTFVPFTAPTLSSGCDTFMFATQNTSDWIKVRMAHGDIGDGAELAERAESALQAAAPGQGTTVTLLDDGRIQFTANTPFKVAPATAAVAKVLGLTPPALAGRDEGRIAARASIPGNDAVSALVTPFRADLSSETYLVLCVDVAGALESPMHAVSGRTAIVRPGWHDVAAPVKCATVRREMSRMNISLSRADGSPYDFQGSDHVLEFDIK